MPNPAQGIEEILNNKYELEIITKEIETILLLFNCSFKKRYPKSTLNIGKIK